MMQARHCYNTLMACLRIFVENVMGNNHCLFSKLAFKQKLKLSGWGLETLYQVATFMFNVHTCLYGNQFTRMVYPRPSWPCDSPCANSSPWGEWLSFCPPHPQNGSGCS